MITEDHIYINQAYGIYLEPDETGETADLSEATSIQIRYKDPDDVVGYLEATETTVDGQQYLYAEMPEDTNSKIEYWELRNWVTFSGYSNPVPGVPHEQLVESV